MDKLEMAKSLLLQLGMPPKQQSIICVLTSSHGKYQERYALERRYE